MQTKSLISQLQTLFEKTNKQVSIMTSEHNGVLNLTLQVEAQLFPWLINFLKPLSPQATSINSNQIILVDVERNSQKTLNFISEKLELIEALTALKKKFNDQIFKSTLDKLYMKYNLSPGKMDRCNVILLNKAAASGNAEEVEFIAHYMNVNINSIDPTTGKTALHTAVQAGSVECIFILLNIPARFDIPDSNGLTAIDYVNNVGNQIISKLFINAYGVHLIKYNVHGGRLQQSILQKIGVYSSAYTDGLILLEFDPNYSLQMMGILHAQLKIIAQTPILHHKNTLLCVGFLRLELILDKLISSGLIAPIDRPGVGELREAITPTIKYYKLLDFSTKQAQKNMMLSVAEPYIEDVLENSNNALNTAKLLRYTFAEVFNFDIFTTSLDTFLQTNEINSSVKDSIIALWKICQGKANLESTYLRMSSTIPNLVAQRMALAICYLEKITTKFSTILDDEQKFLISLEMLVFIKRNPYFNPLEDFHSDIIEILHESFLSEKASMLFQVDSQNAIVQSVNSILKFLGVVADNSFDAPRLEALQKKFDSPILRALTESYRHTISQNERPLVKGLLTNNKDLVQSALNNKEDVDQLFDNSQTPLMMAILQCDMEMFNLILQYKPDVNKRNAKGFFTALYLAINKPNLEMTERLLAAGAEVFDYNCPIMEISKEGSQSIKFSSLPPLLFALDCYEKDKTPVRKNICKALLERGAGIGMPIEYSSLKELADIFDGAVIIGNVFQKPQNSRAITNLPEFFAQIKPTEYKYWRQMFINAQQGPYFKEKPFILRIFPTVVRHLDAAIAAPPASTHGSVLSQLQAPVAPQQSPPLQAMLEAVENNHVDAVTKLLDGGIGVDTLLRKHMNTTTPLIRACLSGSIEVAKLLLERGANINATATAMNISPLHCAIMANKRKLELVHLLISYNPNFLATDSMGQTPLRFVLGTYLGNATERSELAKILDILLSNGAGIGGNLFGFTLALLPNLLDNKVLIGCTNIPPGYKNPIVSIKDFIEKVSENDYPIWVTRLKRFITLESYSQLAPVLNELIGKLEETLNVESLIKRSLEDGQRCLEQKNASDALTHLQKALDNSIAKYGLVDLRLTDIYYKLACAYELAGNYDDALYTLVCAAEIYGAQNDSQSVGKIRKHKIEILKAHKQDLKRPEHTIEQGLNRAFIALQKGDLGTYNKVISYFTSQEARDNILKRLELRKVVIPAANTEKSLMPAHGAATI